MESLLKRFFYFLRSSDLCKVKMKGEPVNIGDGDGMLCS